MKLSHVSKAWRRAIIQTGEVRKRVNRLESKSAENSRRILASEFKAVDDITVLCYTKHLEKSGVVYGWGNKSLGRLTDQATNEKHTLPIEITKFGTVTNIAAGHAASFVIRDTKVIATGYNALGQLGLKNVNFDEVVGVPTKVDLPSIRSLTSCAFSSFAIGTSGRLLSWGSNKFGALGRNHEAAEDATPRMIDTLQKSKIKQVVRGLGQVCCLTTNGEVFTWGHKVCAGHGGLDSHIKVPTKLNIEKISLISCGCSHTLLLSANNKTVWAFGRNKYGQLGYGQELKNAKTPIKVPFSGEKVIVKLQSYGNNSAILSADGEIRVWGKTWNGGPHGSPRLINIGKAVDISLGGRFDGCFMLVLTAENRLYAFGANNYGQCGQGYISEFIEEPVEVRNLRSLHIKQISAGDGHCLIKCEKK